jgi:uncharacterized protein YidB (DUF937 family)
MERCLQRKENFVGLLDGIIGNVVGSMLGGNQSQNPLGAILGGLGAGGSGSGNSLLQIALSMLQQNGGLDEVLGKFRESGMAEQADSWVSTGRNLNISPEQLQQVFGSSAIGDIASKLGMSDEQAGSAISQVMPELINQLTPQGQVSEESNDMISQALESLSSGLPK